MVNIREVRLAAGAEFVIMICGDIMTMPGLPKVPAANSIDVDAERAHYRSVLRLVRARGADRRWARRTSAAARGDSQSCRFPPESKRNGCQHPYSATHPCHRRRRHAREVSGGGARRHPRVRLRAHHDARPHERAVAHDSRAQLPFDAVSIGYPGVVFRGRIAAEPHNLGRGWVGFDFAHALGRPVRIVNDAAMQALGSYSGGRMLFLGLGTGLGVTLIIDGVVEPTELGHIPYKHGLTYEDYLGERGRKRRGNKKWRKSVTEIVAQLKAALEVDYVVLGGGNAARLRRLPRGARLRR